MKAFKRIFAAATLLVTTGLASEVNAQVPLEDFFKNPEKSGLSNLSGRQILLVYGTV